MVLDKRTAWLIGIMALWFWLSFIFLDGSLSHHQTSSLSSWETLGTTVDENTYLQLLSWSDPLTQWEPTDLSPWDLSSTALAHQQSLQDIRALEYLYTKQADTKILVLLIQRLVANYQFQDANKYLQLLMKQDNYHHLLDVKIILYTLFHSSLLDLQDATSIQSIQKYVAAYYADGLLSKDDYARYQGLIALWSQKYADATAAFVSISNSGYAPAVQMYKQTLATAASSAGVPASYQDGLVSLFLLKQWYFTLAKKLSLAALATSPDYILPYQILAYANFLSNTWDVAAEYFSKLANFDTANTARYTFLVGVSYYRMGDYSNAILYLRQVKNPSLLTDVYRYQVLSYIAIDDMDNAVDIWQHLLGQKDIKMSDMVQFFTSMYYAPYRKGQPFSLAQDNRELVGLYMQTCDRMFTSTGDACVFGRVGQGISTQNWTWIASSLLYLSTRYHQSYLYHVLGDYYVSTHQYAKAKEAYTQWLSISDEPNEEAILNDKLKKVMNLL